MKKKILVVASALCLIAIIIAIIATRVYGAIPTAGEGEVLITIADEQLYTALIEDLESQGKEFDDCNGWNAYENEKGYIIITQVVLDSIQELTLNDSNISDISGIQQFRNLRELYLKNNELGDEDLEIIAGISNLKVLDVSRNMLTKIGNISSLTGLEELYIGNQAKQDSAFDLNGLSNLQNLKSLSVAGTGFSDLNLISGMSNLTELDISSNNFNNISEVVAYTNIKNLDISDNGIQDISALRNNSNIEVLKINANKLNNNYIDILKTINSLKGLEVVLNGITEIGDIADLTNLRELNISRNNLKNIDDLLQLTHLTSLDISENKLEEINEEIFNIENVNCRGQILEANVEGLPGTNAQVQFPNIFQQAKTFAEDDDTTYSEETYYDNYLELGNCKLNDNKKSATAEAYTIASSGGCVKILDGRFEGTTLNIVGTSVIYEKDVTNDEKIAEIQEAIGCELKNFDLNLLKSYYEERQEIQTEEEQEDSSDDTIYNAIEKQMDFNFDGQIDEQDYGRLSNYIDKKIDFLYTQQVDGNYRIGDKLIVEPITTNPNVDLTNATVLQLDSNGIFTVRYYLNGEQKELSSSIECIDLVAPRYEGPLYSTTELTKGTVQVTITANEDLIDIYEYEANEEENIEAYNSGWELASDNRTIVRTFNQNTEEEVILQDLAGNTTPVNVSIDNILDGESTDNTNLIMKYNNESGEEYISNTWTNKNVYIDINQVSGGNAKYTINGEGPYTRATTISSEGEYTIVLTNTMDGEDTVNTYKVRIDKTLPEAGTLQFFENNLEGNKINPGGNTSENIYIYLAESTYGNDNLSGHYKTAYTVDGGQEVLVPTIIDTRGTYEIQVITYDLAGNKKLGNKYTITKN